jgi:hypothetical protein
MSALIAVLTPPSDRSSGASRAALTWHVPALLVAAVTLAFALGAIEPWPVGVYQDDGIYTMLARSLATGRGYRYLQMPGAPNATHYPPLYPALLAVLWKLWPDFPRNVTLFKFANAALTAAAGYGSYVFARRRLRFGVGGAALTSAGFIACAPIIVLTVMVLSEPMFLALLVPMLLLAERAADSGRDGDALLAGAGGALLGLVRTLGIVLVPATVLVLASQRRWRQAALAAGAGIAVSLPWQLWVVAHAHDVPDIFLGKYGPYTAWLTSAVRSEGPAWLGRLVWFNLARITEQGWATVSAERLPALIRWPSTVALTLLFALGWRQLVRHAPVTAWTVVGYLALVVAWPFTPARFIWGIWPLVGFTFALAMRSIGAWRPSRAATGVRWGTMAVALLLSAGYVRYNWLGISRRWWTQVQEVPADRAHPLAEWVVANTRPSDIIATDDDVLIFLYTGRRTVPNGTFTPQEHMNPQTPVFSAAALRTILATQHVDYVLATTTYGLSAVQGLARATPPWLRLIRAGRDLAIFAPLRWGSPP